MGHDEKQQEQQEQPETESSVEEIRRWAQLEKAQAQKEEEGDTTQVDGDAAEEKGDDSVVIPVQAEVQAATSDQAPSDETTPLKGAASRPRSRKDSESITSEPQPPYESQEA